MQVTYSPPPSDHHKSPWMYEVTGWDLAKGKAEFSLLEFARENPHTVTCEVPPGTILAWGRLDTRRSKSKFHFGVVLASGEVFPIQAGQIRDFYHGL